ncbi:hypothetical protein CAOG_00255 [Capsaspora owczarzaki ATCC 30864]|nr:hypothetical protein CAOG_00255 [Capsaspora owczarzaki ATCC 30864]|eukprot:XP_004365126.1 hypothetical protein CAOG_00255 [Capsaspora owczarzaki ATCC 30864]
MEEYDESEVLIASASAPASLTADGGRKKKKKKPASNSTNTATNDSSAHKKQATQQLQEPFDQNQNEDEEKEEDGGNNRHEDSSKAPSFDRSRASSGHSYGTDNSSINGGTATPVGGLARFPRTESKTMLVHEDKAPLLRDETEDRILSSHGLGGGGHAHGFISEGRMRTTTVSQTMLNLVKSYIASGILGLPYAFMQSGVVASVIIMVILVAMSMHCMLVLVDCKYKLINQGAVTYADVAILTYGRYMGYLVDFLVCFTQFGFAVVYMVYVSTNLASYWDIDHAQVYILLMLFPLFVGMSWIRQMRWIGPVSAFANLCLLTGVAVVIGASIQQLAHGVLENTGTISIFDAGGLPITFGMCVYAIEGIGVILPCETAMKEPKHFPKVLCLSLGFAGLCYVFFGILVYCSFGDQISDQLLDTNSTIPLFVAAAGQPWPAFENISRISLVIAIFLSFPIQLFVVIDILEEAMFKRVSTHRRLLKENIGRFLLCVLGAVIALTVPKFSLLISLIGAMGGSTLQFVLPSIFHLRLFPESSTPRKALSIFYILFGLAGGSYGTYDTINKLVEQL